MGRRQKKSTGQRCISKFFVSSKFTKTVSSCAHEEVVVLDFETTGLNPKYDRVIEVGAAIVVNLKEESKIVKTFSTLCDPQRAIPKFITDFTGITPEMVKGKPTPQQMMLDLKDFVGDRPIVAHNVAFDSKFFRAELERAGDSVVFPNNWICTLLLARRLIPDSKNHKLGTLKDYIKYETKKGHQDHRALDDVMVTCKLWQHLRYLVDRITGRSQQSMDLFMKISRTPKKKIAALLTEVSATGWPIAISQPAAASQQQDKTEKKKRKPSSALEGNSISKKKKTAKKSSQKWPKEGHAKNCTGQHTIMTNSKNNYEDAVFTSSVDKPVNKRRGFLNAGLFSLIPRKLRRSTRLLLTQGSPSGTAQNREAMSFFERKKTKKTGR
mmetsp:Transcript_37011/g.60923  ORF Transcript_37011/g.60923 Transcript_37011/m.60923 type:complete len:382 (+) Transcript_37011:108-1253(+)